MHNAFPAHALYTGSDIVNGASSDPCDSYRLRGHGLLRRLFILAVLLVGLTTFTGQTQAGDNGASARAEALTHSLVALNKHHARANASARKALLDELIDTAIARQQALAEMLQDNPAGVFEVALPEQVRGRMPEAVRTHLEQAVEVKGELEALYEDYEDGSHKLLYFLKANGKRYSVHFAEQPARIAPDRPVRLSGLQLKNDSEESTGLEHDGSLIAAGEEVIQYLDAGGGDGSPPPVEGGEFGEPVHPIGEQPTVVLLVNFQDTATSTPYTLAQVHDAVFGTVSDYLMEASYGQTSLSGDVYGWLTLPMDSTCNTTDIGEAADAAAMASGIDLSSYGRFIYIFKGTASCNWNGAANLWVYPSRAWIKGNINPQVIAHELGHNLGLNHSYLLECGDKVIETTGADCQHTADDKFDTMGSADDPAHYNAFQKDRLGWFRPDEVMTVTGDGTFYLSPFELAQSTHPKTLKILKELDPEGRGATWYYLEYRQALGFDGFITGNSNVENGILVHTGADFNANSSTLLDMTPASSALVTRDRSDPALVVGKSFTDPAAGVTLTTDHVDSTAAVVSVSFGPQTCTAQAPQMEIFPASQSAAVGTALNYTVSITNQDTVACGQSTFSLDRVIPSGWSGNLSASALTLLPGETGSATLSVTSSASAVTGTYGIDVNLVNPGQAIHTTSKSASYTVVATCTYDTPSLVLSPGSQSGDPGTTLVYAISLTNHDSQACSESTFELTRILPGWGGSVSPNSMTLAPGATGAATLTVTSLNTADPDSYVLQVQASDNQEATHYAIANATYLVNDTTQTGDNVPPTTPSALAASTTSRQVSLSWNPSSDNISVTGYQVYRNGSKIAETTDSGYIDRDGADGVIYEYTVDARDASGNASPKSNPVMAGKAKAKAKGKGGGKGKGPNK